MFFQNKPTTNGLFYLLYFLRGVACPVHVSSIHEYGTIVLNSCIEAMAIIRTFYKRFVSLHTFCNDNTQVISDTEASANKINFLFARKRGDKNRFLIVYTADLFKSEVDCLPRFLFSSGTSNMTSRHFLSHFFCFCIFVFSILYRIARAFPSFVSAK